MGIIGIILLVIFCLSALLLIVIVLFQDEQGEGMGGIFGGGSSNVYGSRSGNIITKTTSVIAAIFIICSFLLAWVNRTSDSDTLLGNLQNSEQSSGNWWEANTVEDGSTDATLPDASGETTQ